jgi:hypothetical protein
VTGLRKVLLIGVLLLVVISSGCGESKDKITLDIETCNPEDIEIKKGETLSFKEEGVKSYAWLVKFAEIEHTPNIAESKYEKFNHLTFNFVGTALLSVQKENGGTCNFYVVIQDV